MSPQCDCADSARTDPSLLIAHDRDHAADSRRSATYGVIQFVCFFVVYIVVFLATITLPGWWLKGIGGMVLFFLVFRLALLGHDAGHGSLTNNARLNRWLGRLAFLPCYMPYAAWLANHNALHHAFTNLRTSDPFWPPRTKAEFDSLGFWPRMVERCYRTLPGVALYSIVAGWKLMWFPPANALVHIPNRRAFLLERITILVFAFAQFAMILVWPQALIPTLGFSEEPIAAFVTAVALPNLLMNWLSGLLALLQHTHPRVRWYDDIDEWRHAQSSVTCTVHLVAPWPFTLLLGDSLEHTAHHVAPKTPTRELSAFQHQLESSMPGAIQIVSLLDCWRIFACCKLYDYDRHRWLDYDGEQTLDEG